MCGEEWLRRLEMGSVDVKRGGVGFFGRVCGEIGSLTVSFRNTLER